MSQPHPGFVERLVHWLIEWRWPLLLLSGVLAALSVVEAGRLEVDRSIENMFAPGDRLLIPYGRLTRAFGADEVVLAAYVDRELMTTAGLERLRQLTGRLQTVPGVVAVLSLNNGPLGDAILDERNPLAQRFLDLFTGYTVGADRCTTAVACLLEKQSGANRTQTVDRLRTTVEAHDASGVIVGEPVMVADGFRLLDNDGRLLTRVSTLLLVLTIVFSFRSLRWVVVPLATVGLSIVATEAIIASSRLRLSLVSSMLTAIITIVGVATVVHLIVRFRELRESGRTPRAALEQAGVELAAPIFWACATDAAGFGSLIVAKVEPVHDFGVMMLIGSLVVLLSVGLTVPGLALVGRFDADPRRAWGERGLDIGLDRLSRMIQRRPLVLWVASIVVAVLAAIGCARLQVETDFTKSFRSDSQVVRAYEFVESRLGGAGVWDIILPAPENLDWPFLQRVLTLEQRLRNEVRVADEEGRPVPGLTKVLSVADAIEAVALGQLGQIPVAALRDRAVTAGLAEMHAQIPAFYEALVSRDPDHPERRLLRIMLRARERQESQQKKTLIVDVERISREVFPEAQVTGYFVLLTNLIESTTRDQWLTFGLASLGIAVMMLVAFRSLPLALAALIPNALPIFFVSGLMGWLGLRINMGAAMIAAVSMGLSVDSSIHYITAFHRLRDQGLTLHEALAAGHQSVGRAMVFSTAALVIGFSALCFSQFVPTIYFGALMGLAMLGGLVGNLIVLPLLLAIMPTKKGSGVVLRP